MTETEGERGLDDPDAGRSRRSFLGAGIGAAAAIAAASSMRSASAAPLPANPPPPAPPTVPTLRFLLDRVTYGFRAATSQRAQALGYQAFLEEQLDPDAIPDGRVDNLLAPFTTLSMSAKQLHDQYYAQGLASVPMTELKTAAIVRAAFSERQLYERMVEFWTDHFNIDHADSQLNVLKTMDDRDVIRAHALGKFPELLEASAHSGAMLFYLGNYRNTAVQPNENYAREIMELHSLGVGNFSEQDVREVSRCLTGYSYRQPAHPAFGAFYYDASHHDDGAKLVLGSMIPAGGGVLDGQKVVRKLALHPLTARFVATKLCRWFLTYSPPPGLVDAVAAAYTSTNGDIKSMLRALFDPANVGLVPSDTVRKIKRPFHLVASVLRASKIDIALPSPLAEELGRMGQQPFAWGPPNGYPDTFPAWGSGLQPRWSFVARLFANQIPGVTVAAGAMFGATPKSALAGKANLLLTGGRLSFGDQDAIQDYANAYPALTDALKREVLALTASSPSFQTY